MIVYGHRTFPLDLRSFLERFANRLDRLPARPPHDLLVDLLVDFGEAESAACDALMPEHDDDRTDVAAWGRAAHALAAALVASWAGESPAPALQALRERVAPLIAASQPGTVSASTAEGFAYYALTPEQYIAAAERFAARDSPAAAVCIGIRSIGACLAHVVAATLERRGVTTATWSVRPRGHPFDRRLQVTRRLRHAIGGVGASHVLVVDEGPGLSGSSFASVCAMLHDAGVDASNIVLFPSWDAPADALRSEAARRAWTSHRREVVGFEEVWIDSGRLGDGGGTLTDVSAGGWRPIVFGADESRWPATQPQHERRKYLTSRDGAQRLLKFEGLGRYGKARRTRAERLAGAGFAPPPIALAHGFLERDWVDAEPLGRGALREDGVGRLGQYIAFVAREFPTGGAASTADVIEMLVTNASKGLGIDAGAAREWAASLAAATTAAPEVRIDGRMLPYEWLRTAGGTLLKTDGLDHHDDDFFTGCRDIAWDLAGAIEEFALDVEDAAALTAAYVAESRDVTAGNRMPLYRAAYLAYRLGYVTLAAESLRGTADAARFTRLQARYRRLLAARAAPLLRTRRR